MTPIEKEVEIEVTEIYTKLIINERYAEARMKLYKLFLAFYSKLENTQVKRNLLHRLILIEKKLYNEHAVFTYVTQLKQDMDKDVMYREKFPGEYCEMLSYYCECPYIEIDVEENLEYFRFILDYYESAYEVMGDPYNYARLKEMEFKIAKLLGNHLHMLEIIEELNLINNIQAVNTVNRMIAEIREFEKKDNKTCMTIHRSVVTECQQG